MCWPLQLIGSQGSERFVTQRGWLTSHTPLPSMLFPLSLHIATPNMVNLPPSQRRAAQLEVHLPTRHGVCDERQDQSFHLSRQRPSRYGECDEGVNEREDSPGGRSRGRDQSVRSVRSNCMCTIRAEVDSEFQSDSHSVAATSGILTFLLVGGDESVTASECSIGVDRCRRVRASVFDSFLSLESAHRCADSWHCGLSSHVPSRDNEMSFFFCLEENANADLLQRRERCSL